MILPPDSTGRERNETARPLCASAALFTRLSWLTCLTLAPACQAPAPMLLTQPDANGHGVRCTSPATAAAPIVGSSRDLKWDCEPVAKGRTDCVNREFLTLTVTSVLEATAVCGRSTAEVEEACRISAAGVLVDRNFFVKRLGEYVDYDKGLDFPIPDIVFPFYYKYGKDMIRNARIGVCLPIRHLTSDAKSHYLGCNCRAGYFFRGGEPRFKQIEGEFLKAAFSNTKPAP